MYSQNESTLDRLKDLQKVEEEVSQCSSVDIGCDVPFPVYNRVYRSDGTSFVTTDFLHKPRHIIIEQPYLHLFTKALRLGLLQLIEEEQNKLGLDELRSEVGGLAERVEEIERAWGARHPKGEKK